MHVCVGGGPSERARQGGWGSYVCTRRPFDYTVPPKSVEGVLMDWFDRCSRLSHSLDPLQRLNGLSG